MVVRRGAISLSHLMRTEPTARPKPRKNIKGGRKMKTFSNSIFGLVERVRSVFIPQEGDCDLFVEMMKVKAAGDAAALARHAKKQKARAKLPENVRDFYEAFEEKLHKRTEKNNSYFGGLRS
jgi:ribosomal 50S subunit-associated protein YjgA (DUF615 family)